MNYFDKINKVAKYLEAFWALLKHTTIKKKLLGQIVESLSYFLFIQTSGHAGTLTATTVS